MSFVSASVSVSDAGVCVCARAHARVRPSSLCHSAERVEGEEEDGEIRHVPLLSIPEQWEWKITQCDTWLPVLASGFREAGGWGLTQRHPRVPERGRRDQRGAGRWQHVLRLRRRRGRVPLTHAHARLRVAFPRRLRAAAAARARVCAGQAGAVACAAPTHGGSRRGTLRTLARRNLNSDFLGTGSAP